MTKNNGRKNKLKKGLCVTTSEILYTIFMNGNETNEIQINEIK